MTTQFDRTRPLPWLLLLAGLALILAPGPGLAQGLSEAEQDGKKLYRQFLPKPKDLGAGWLLPWNLPAALRRHQSEAQYWKTMAGAGQTAPGDPRPVVSRLVYGADGSQAKTLDAWVNQVHGDIGFEDIPPGEPWDILVVAPALLAVHEETSPSLKRHLEATASYMGRAQVVMAGLMAEEGVALDSGQGGAPSAQALVEDLRARILEDSAATRRISAMTYYKSANWSQLAQSFQVLEGEDEQEAIGRVDVGVVKVVLIILDREKMDRVVDDLSDDDLIAFRDSVNGPMRKFRDFAIASARESERADLEVELRETEDEALRAELLAELASLDQRYAALAGSIPTMEIEVYTRDFGDNCYVTNMSGTFDLLEMEMPFTALNASLRNGNAIVLMSIGGSFTPEQKKSELDVFLSALDARTAFFRE